MTPDSMPPPAVGPSSPRRPSQIPRNRQRGGVLPRPGDDCTPTGKPSVEVPQRTTAAGHPVRLCTIMCEKSLISTKPWWCGLAGVGIAGQMITS